MAKKNPTKVKSKTINKKSKHIKVLVAHDNRLGPSTTKAHKFAEKISKDPNFETILDKEYWNPMEKTSKTETNRRETEMVNKSDVVVRIIPAPSKTGQPRHEGAKSEVLKAMRASKPVLEIYERGSRDSPNRPVSQKNYGKKVEVHIKEGETLEKAFKTGIKELKKKGLL